MEKEKMHEKGKNTLKKKKCWEERERRYQKTKRREGTWLEINRNVTIFQQTPYDCCPFPSTFPSLCSALADQSVHSAAEHRENGRGERMAKPRGDFAAGYVCTLTHRWKTKRCTRLSSERARVRLASMKKACGQGDRASVRLTKGRKTRNQKNEGRKGGWNRVKQGVGRWKERVSCGQGAHVSLEIARFGYRVSSLELIRAWKTETRRSIYHVSHIVSPKKCSNRVFLRLRSLVSAFRSFYRPR